MFCFSLLNSDLYRILSIPNLIQCRIVNSLILITPIKLIHDDSLNVIHKKISTVIPNVKEDTQKIQTKITVSFSFSFLVIQKFVQNHHIWTKATAQEKSTRMDFRQRFNVINVSMLFEIWLLIKFFN